MNKLVELIYCGDSDPKNYKMAHDAGFLLGCQLPNKRVHYWCNSSSKFNMPEKPLSEYNIESRYALHFADQNWKEPDRQKYMEDVSFLRPKVATVLDLERPSQFGTVMEWAEEISQYVDTVVIIPKVFGIIDDIPETINGKNIRLGYSVPTSFGGTKFSIHEFKDRPVHLLGGSPERQMKLCYTMNVVSVDSNMILKFGNMCQVWCSNDVSKCTARLEPLGNVIKYDGLGAYRKAFELSCANVVAAWKKFLAGDKQQKRLFDW